MSTPADIFLSYSREDQTTARRFAQGLEAQGFTVWWDAALRTGESFDQVIEKALNEAKAVVVLWSKKSVDSRWVRAEATMADRNKTLAPVMIEACQRPIIFELMHAADLSHWTGDTKDPAWQALVGDIRALIAEDARHVAAAPADSRTTGPRATVRWYKSTSTLIAVIALVLIAGALLYGRLRTAVMPAQSATTGGAAPAAASEPSSFDAVAVLPFANLTGDASKDYLGDGMAEEVINLLTKVPGLQVPARTSSFAYKDRNIDIRQIARDLNVGAVLEGSVRSAGNRIRITAQLINARNGLHLWSQTYDTKFTDLFQLQDDMAKAIVAALQVNLQGVAPVSVSQAPPTRDVAAYDLYLQGYSVMLRGTPDSLRLSLGLYQQALARDPTFARAYAARSRARLTYLVRGYPLQNARNEAQSDAERALALDPNLDVAQQALGNVSALRANWLQAETSYRAALAADTANPDVHSGYAMVVLAPTGQLHKAQLEGNEAYRLAPASNAHIAIVSQLSFATGNDADAVRFADLAVALGSPAGSAALAQVYALTEARSGHYVQAADRAAAALSPAVRAMGGAEVIRQVYGAVAEPAKRPAARQALENLARKLPAGAAESGSRRDFIIDFTMIDALGPAFDLANQYLDEFIRTGTGGGAAWAFLWIPEMRPFRMDPRFEAYVRRLNLIAYWQRYGPPDQCTLTQGKLACH